MIRYPSDQLHEEVAYLALNAHWPLGEILALEHRDRRRWVTEIQSVVNKLTSD